MKCGFQHSDTESASSECLNKTAWKYEYDTGFYNCLQHMYSCDLSLLSSIEYLWGLA